MTIIGEDDIFLENSVRMKDRIGCCSGRGELRVEDELGTDQEKQTSTQFKLHPPNYCLTADSQQHSKWLKEAASVSKRQSPPRIPAQ